MSTVKQLSEQEALKFILDSLHRHNFTDAYPQLQSNFPDYEPSSLFRSLVLQQSWVEVCKGNLNDATILIQELGDSPGQIFCQMWRQTTRNKTRQILYEYLRKISLLSEADENNYSILQKLLTFHNEEQTAKKQRPFFSFSQKSKNENNSPDITFENNEAIMKVFNETIQNLTEIDSKQQHDEENEIENLVFPNLFNELIPKEPISNSFVGNIALIESCPPKILKYIKTNEGSIVERLWILHCQHKITEMKQLFSEEIESFKSKKSEPTVPSPKKFFQFPSSSQNKEIPTKKPKKLKCLKFCNLYHDQLNLYETETLFDLLAVNGYFCECELNDIVKLLNRICRNKLLFNQSWWSQSSSLNFEQFLKNFAKFCSEWNLYLIFEMFIINHPKSKDVDLSDEHPMIRFIWNLWVKRDAYLGSVSNFQLFADENGQNSTDFSELWKNSPEDSLAPLSLFIWNKDPKKFLPNSPESNLLAERLKNKYPLLASLVKGETPHPQSVKNSIPENSNKWRSLLFTSKYDLELHDTIKSHFEKYDFSKIFTNYYGEENFKGQPPFPHFDHPDLILSPSDPPYIHYILSMLPVSAFQQAINDNVNEEQFKSLCCSSMKEALLNKDIRLAALTFIELTDFKFKTDFAIDFKLALSVFDHLTQTSDSPKISSFLKFEGIESLSSLTNFIDNRNSSSKNEMLIEHLSNIFLYKSKESAEFIQKKLHSTNLDVLLLSLIVGFRCNLPPDYEIIEIIASKMHPAELVLFIDRAEEIGCKYNLDEVAKIIEDKMPPHSLKDHILFLLTNKLPCTNLPNSSDNGKEVKFDEEQIEVDKEPALVVFNALNKKGDEPPFITLLNEAMMRHDSFYSIIACSVEGADPSLCALVTLMTMTNKFSFDVDHPPDKEVRGRLFIEVIRELLLDGNSDEVLKSIELFSKDSIILPIVNFYNSVFIFAFKRAQLSITAFHEILKKNENNFDDELLGKITIDDLLDTFFPLEESLAKHCASQSQIHLFRYLQLLKEAFGSDSNSDLDWISPFLRSRVELAGVIESYDDFRRALTKCDLIGDQKKIVSDLIANHSLSLGIAAAKCFEISSSQVIKEWLDSQFLKASTVDDALCIYKNVVKLIEHPNTLCSQENEDYDDEEENDIIQIVDPLFFISLFATLIQYIQPSSLLQILKFTYKLLKLQDIKGKESFLVSLQSLILSVKIFSDHSIDTDLFVRSNSRSSSKESIESIIQILFPPRENDDEYNNFIKLIPNDVPLNLENPILYSINSIRDLFNIAMDKTIDICLNEKGLEKAEMLDKWQNRNTPSIIALKSVEILFDIFNHCENKPNSFTSNQKNILIQNGMKDSYFTEKEPNKFVIESTIDSGEIQAVLDSLSLNFQMFKLISIHFQSSMILRAYSDTDSEFKLKATSLINPSLVIGKERIERTIQFLSSPLSLMVNNQDLISNLIQASSVSFEVISECLYSIFIKTLIRHKEAPNSAFGFILIDDYGEKFMNFAQLCKDVSLFGDKLLTFARRQINNEVDENDVKIASDEKRISILTNILLHASLSTSRIDECAKLLDTLYSTILSDADKYNQQSEVYEAIIQIVEIFPEPSLLHNFITFILAVNEDDIDSIQQKEISPNLCIELVNEARQFSNFKPDQFLNMTLECKLYHEHAKLQMESGNNLLAMIYEEKSDKNESENVSISGNSSSSEIQLDKKEQKRQKKLEKQKAKEEKNELKKLKKQEKKKSKTFLNACSSKEEILQESSRHLLLALAYSLHEKCYYLSLECLKKLSLISLQHELMNTNSSSPPNSSTNLISNNDDKNLNVFGLNEDEVLNLMKTREFPFALTIAIAYDMDNESNWSKCLFTQSIEKQGDDFLTAFIYFRAFTENVWNGVVDRYKEFFESRERNSADKEVKERMKQFLLKIPNLVERYRLLKKLNFKNEVDDMKEKHPVICEWCEKVF